MVNLFSIVITGYPIRIKPSQGQAFVLQKPRTGSLVIRRKPEKEKGDGKEGRVEITRFYACRDKN
ncbi:MAG: hypothetical protein SRB1_01550 [Desulfobacteraceae bacterium Eth-SRB1]|nr:MAG: hypothetical protein SRB1_01550 [Desulfobacteraceae bacterium Eth-SRB1]